MTEDKDSTIDEENYENTPDNVPDNMLDETDNVIEQDHHDVIPDDRTIWPCVFCGVTETKSGSDFSGLTSVRSHMRRSHSSLYKKYGGNDIDEARYEELLDSDIPPTPPVETKKAPKRAVRSTGSVQMEKAKGKFTEDDKVHLEEIVQETSMNEQELKLEESRKRLEDARTGRKERTGDWRGDTQWDHRYRERPEKPQTPLMKDLKEKTDELHAAKVYRMLVDGEDPEDSDSDMDQAELNEMEKERDKAIAEAKELKQEIKFMGMMDDKVKPLEEKLRAAESRAEKAEREDGKKPGEKLANKAADQLGDTAFDGGVVNELKGLLKDFRMVMKTPPSLGPPPVRERVQSEDGEFSSVADRVAAERPDLVHTEVSVADVQELAERRRQDPQAQGSVSSSKQAPVPKRKEKLHLSVAGDDTGVKTE